MSEEKFYSRFTEKKSSKAEAKNRRREFNRDRDKYFDEKRRGLDKKKQVSFETRNVPVDAKIISSFNCFDEKKLPADAVPLSSPSPTAFNLSQHQGLFQRVSSSHQVAKVLELQIQHQSFQ